MHQFTGLDFLFSEELPLEGKEEVVGSDGDQHEAASGGLFIVGAFSSQVGIVKEASTCKLQTHRGTPRDGGRTFVSGGKVGVFEDDGCGGFEEVGMAWCGLREERKKALVVWLLCRKIDGMGFYEEGQRLRGGRPKASGEGQGFFKGHTPKGIGLRVADSHTGNHREDDFTPPETFGGNEQRRLGVGGLGVRLLGRGWGACTLMADFEEVGPPHVCCIGVAGRPIWILWAYMAKGKGFNEAHVLSGWSGKVEGRGEEAIRVPTHGIN
ncbi:hypothetical protein Tco_0389668 [Tanacetum coccineum]